jgi:hypothetical protein
VTTSIIVITIDHPASVDELELADEIKGALEVGTDPDETPLLAAGVGVEVLAPFHSR